MPAKKRLLRVLLAFTIMAVTADRPATAAFTEVAVAFGVADGDSMSYTAGFVDHDGDGDPDLYVTNHWKGPPDLFRNDGGTGFVSRSEHYGPGNGDRHDALWADFDNDGDPDQYIIRGGGQANELFWNLGWESFVDGAAVAGVTNAAGRGREITLADFNGDGLLDIFVVNEIVPGSPRPSRLFWNDGDGTFTAHPNTDVVFETAWHVSSADYDGDGNVDLITTTPAFDPGKFYRNDGDSTWTDVTASVFPGIAAPLGQAQGLAWGDYDNDGLLDLLVSGGNRAVWDFAGLEADSLRWYTQCDSAEYKTMEIVTDGDSVTVSATTSDWSAITCYAGGGGASVSVFPSGFALGDLSGEPPALAGGQRGLFLWRVPGAGADTVRLRAGGPGPGPLLVGGAVRANGSGVLSWSTAGHEPPPPFTSNDWSDRLYHNEGDGTFTEVTQAAFAVNDSTMNSAGGAWGDYDNDGWLDVYVTRQGTIASGNPPNSLFRNNGDGTFSEVAAAEGVQGANVGRTDGACWADVNGDGSLDLFVDNGAEHPPFGVGPRQLFRNAPNGNHWLRLRLRGLASNGSGIGARVRVRNGSRRCYRWRLGESDDSFSNDTTLHFGLGPDASVQVRVEWPSGQIDTYNQVSADASYIAIEGVAIRSMQDAQLTLTSGDVADTIPVGSMRTYAIPVDNLGGIAANYAATAEDCAGTPIAWISVDPESGSVWPGGTDPLELTVNTAGLGEGVHCGRVIFADGTPHPDTLTVTLDVTSPEVDSPVLDTIPRRFRLSTPRPNPTQAGTSLLLAMPGAASVRVSVFDVIGRRIVDLAVGARPAGTHPIIWDGRDAAGRPVGPGVYLVRAGAGGATAVRKVVVR